MPQAIHAQRHHQKRPPLPAAHDRSLDRGDGVRQLHALQAADRRLPRPQSSAGDDHDRGAGACARGGRDAHHVSPGVGAQRRDGSAGRAQLLWGRSVGDLRRVRLGNRHLRGPTNRDGEDRAGSRPHAEGDSAPTRPNLVDHGPDHARGDVQRNRRHVAHGGSNAGRLGRAAAVADDPGRRAGRHDGRWAETVPGAR